jgi:uncharacterized damage-inducible protein DinB
MTPQIATLFAKYNRSMNERVFEACRKLSAEELSADRGAFFGSILGTLNHIAVGDTVWLHRFAQHAARFAQLEELSAIPVPTSLRQTIAADLVSLFDYRQRLDGIIERWGAELTPEHLASTLSYASMAGVRSNKRFDAVLQHFFNHQTHHRGQVSTLLFQAGVDVGVTDFITFVPNDEILT